MFKVRVMNKIAPAGLRKLDPSNYQIGQDLERYQGMLIRSADLHSHQFPKELLAIARAGSGTNNIPIDKCNERVCGRVITIHYLENREEGLCGADLELESSTGLGGVCWAASSGSSARWKRA